MACWTPWVQLAAIAWEMSSSVARARVKSSSVPGFLFSRISLMTFVSRLSFRCSAFLPGSPRHLSPQVWVKGFPEREESFHHPVSDFCQSVLVLGDVSRSFGCNPAGPAAFQPLP